MNWKSLFTTPESSTPQEHYPLYPIPKQPGLKEMVAKPLEVLRKTYKKAVMGILGATMMASGAPAQEQSMEVLPTNLRTVAFDNGTPEKADRDEKHTHVQHTKAGHRVSFHSTDVRGSYTMLPTPKGPVKGFRNVEAVQQRGDLRLFIEDTLTHRTYSVPFPEQGDLTLPPNNPLFENNKQQFTYSVGSINNDTRSKEIYSTVYLQGTPSPASSSHIANYAVPASVVPTETPTAASPLSLPQNEQPIPHDPWELGLLATAAGITYATTKKKNTQDIEEPIEEAEEVALPTATLGEQPEDTVETILPEEAPRAKNYRREELDSLYTILRVETHEPMLKNIYTALEQFYEAVKNSVEDTHDLYVGILRHVSQIVHTLKTVAPSIAEQRVEIFSKMLSSLLQSFSPTAPQDGIKLCMKLKTLQQNIEGLIPTSLNQHLETIINIRTSPASYPNMRNVLSAAVQGLQSIFQSQGGSSRQEVEQKLMQLGYIPSEASTRTTLEQLKQYQFRSLLRQEPLSRQHIKNPSILTQIFINPTLPVPAIDSDLLLQILNTA